MRRKVYERFLNWKNKSSGRMPLLVYGARQVGKTHSIRQFGQREYYNMAYFNLEFNQAVSSYFSENIDPGRIIRFLETESNERILPGKTLIVFDEIQSCERALTSLKYFNENAPEYHIIGAGSLLGVAINREQYSFPVGNVDFVTMFPMDFEEFLWSLDELRLAEDIRNSFESNVPMPRGLHEKALELLRQYLITGGMPRAVLTYKDSGSFLPVSDVHSKILSDYLADMSKYATNTESVKIRAAFDSIPVQLAKDNKKFQYKLAQKGGTASIFGAAIDWLEFAGVVLKCERLEHGTVPILVYRDLSSFKLYMGDTGLLSTKSGIPHSVVLSAGSVDNTFLGAICENYVAQALSCNGHDLHYWTSNGIAELDFVIQKNAEVIAVEVKAGIRTKSRSLNLFTEKYSPAYSIRISSKNFGFENNIKSVPLYAVFCV
ncbi:MAG: ATP-binding protein [Oscillospiraceae bacterium]|nr:ATP-binding protein [Oscillospiraceae bacterium]